MQTITGIDIPIEFVDFFFKNKPVVEDKIVDITYDSFLYTGNWFTKDRKRLSNFYIDYDVEFTDDLNLESYEVLNCYSLDSDNLIFNCQYFEIDDDGEEGDLIETIQKEISYVKLMGNSRFIARETNWFGKWSDNYTYKVFKFREKEYREGEEVDEYGNRVRTYETATQPSFSYDEENPSVKMTSIIFEIDCRGSIDLNDWNVLEMKCDFY
jgi:hypothetical protein